MIMGADIANSGAKCATTERRESFESGLRLVAQEELSLLKFNQKSETIYEFEGEKFKYDTGGVIASSSRNIEKYSSKIYLLEHLISISQFIKKEDKIKLVVGVPCEHHKNDKIIKDIETLLKKTHVLRVHEGEKEVSKIIEIVEVTVLAQPMGSLVHYLVDEDLNPHVELLNQRILTVDIGYGTLDVTESIGLDIINYESENLGCLDIKRKFHSTLKQKYPNLSIKRTDIDYKISPIIKKMGTVYTFEEELNYAKTSVALEVISYLNGNFEFSDYDRIVFTGGGTLQLKEALSGNIKTDNIDFIDNPVMANVLGYLKYGLIKMN